MRDVLVDVGRLGVIAATVKADTGDVRKGRREVRRGNLLLRSVVGWVVDVVVLLLLLSGRYGHADWRAIIDSKDYGSWEGICVRQVRRYS